MLLLVEQAESEMDITNTDEELRILEETRRRLEEQEANQMEASARSLPPTIVIDESPDFDQFFKQVLRLLNYFSDRTFY